MIRTADITDAPEMARLAAELGYPMSPDEMKYRLSKLLADSRHHIAVAAHDGAPLLGWMHVEHRTSIEGGDRAELMGLIVDTTAQRHGIGRRLLDAAEHWAQTSGLATRTVRSNAARTASHPFYEALGYVRLKTQHVYTKSISAG